MAKLVISQRKRADVKLAVDSGWQLDSFTGNGHMRFRHPGTHEILILASTTKYPRAIKNAIQLIRRKTP